MKHRIYIENYYLDHLIFGGVTTLKSYFEHISSYTNMNKIEEQESKFLLTELVCSLFDIKLDVGFKYRKSIISMIKNKIDYVNVETSMKNEILRLYTETQNYLKDNIDTEYIRLYRGLNPVERNHFYNNGTSFKSNIITSFTTEKRRYAKEIQVAVDIPIQNILFWENLCPSTDKGSFMCTGLSLEREVIVFNEKNTYDIAEVTYYDSNTRSMREIEEKYGDF